MEKERIKFIDLAKGFCIIMVVWYHVDIHNLIYFNEQTGWFFQSFRMPLYFMLSGFFISFRKGHKQFIENKINKIIIPFMFFIFITNTIFWIIKDIFHGYDMGYFDSPFQWVSGLQFWYDWQNCGLNNTPLWFLCALFNAYMIYLIIDKITKGKEVLTLVILISVSIISNILLFYNIQIPFLIGTALQNLIFIIVGNQIRKRTSILQSKQSASVNISVAILLFGVLYFTVLAYHTMNNFIAERFIYYFNGIIGTIAIILISKTINYIPIVSYFGRYSIVVLGLHQPIMGNIMKIFRLLFENEVLIKTCTLFITLAICLLCIKILVRFLPWFVAQKNLIYFKA